MHEIQKFLQFEPLKLLYSIINITLNMEMNKMKTKEENFNPINKQYLVIWCILIKERTTYSIKSNFHCLILIYVQTSYFTRAKLFHKNRVFPYFTTRSAKTNKKQISSKDFPEKAENSHDTHHSHGVFGVQNLKDTEKL